MGINERAEVLKQAKERIKLISFGDPVTNVCAGEGNPRKHAYFVEHVIKKSKNRFKVQFTEHFAKCTDRKGNFWSTDIEVIFQGHLNDEKCQELFAPIWEANYK